LRKKNEEEYEDVTKNDSHSICTPLAVKESATFPGSFQDFLQNSGSAMLPMGSFGFYGDMTSSFKMMSEYSQNFPSFNEFQYSG
jgi:hypothetical protein